MDSREARSSFQAVDRRDGVGPAALDAAEVVPDHSSRDHKALMVVGTILCVILAPLLVANLTLIVRDIMHVDEVSGIGGRFPLIVLTDSMYPEIQSGDLILCKTIDPASVREGDIISFLDPESAGTAVVTHRVVEITTNEEGEPAWRTKGDANNAEDEALVPYGRLVGIYRIRIAGLGNVALFMQTTPGLVVCMGVPLVLLIGYDLLTSRRQECQRQKGVCAPVDQLDERPHRHESRTSWWFRSALLSDGACCEGSDTCGKDTRRPPPSHDRWFVWMGRTRMLWCEGIHPCWAGIANR